MKPLTLAQQNALDRFALVSRGKWASAYTAGNDRSVMVTLVKLGKLESRRSNYGTRVVTEYRVKNEY
jgi:hypothetical protein